MELCYDMPDGSLRRVDLVGVEVAFVHLFEETMGSTLFGECKELLGKTTYLLMPVECLADVRPGTCSLVFLYVDQTGPNQDGLQVSFRPAVGWQLLDDKLHIAVYDIVDGTLMLPQTLFEDAERSNLEPILHMAEANRYLESSGVRIPRLSHGMTIEDLKAFFAYITQ